MCPMSCYWYDSLYNVSLILITAPFQYVLHLYFNQFASLFFQPSFLLELNLFELLEISHTLFLVFSCP